MVGENRSILFLLRLWPFFGGGETVTICLANEFVKKGYNVHVLYFKYTDSKKGLLIDERVRTHCIDGVRCDETFTDESVCGEVLDYLIQYVNRNEIDIVINQWWPASYISGLKKQTKACVIKCNHTAFLRPSFEGRGIKNVLKRVFKPIYHRRIVKLALKEVNEFRTITDKYVFLSKGFVDQYLKYNHNNNKDWVTFIPNPIVFDNRFEAEELDKKEHLVLFVGRLVDNLKRLSIALRGWSEVEKRKELDEWKFVVVGDGPDRRMLEAMSNDLGLKRVSFEGFQKPERYYRRAMILVQTSRYEGFGMTILEAQQCGCVPIAMNTFLTVHDLIESGSNGIIVENKQSSFDRGLINLMKKVQYRKKMAIQAIKTAQSFSIHSIACRWEKLFKDILE